MNSFSVLITLSAKGGAGGKGAAKAARDRMAAKAVKAETGRIANWGAMEATEVPQETAGSEDSADRVATAVSLSSVRKTLPMVIRRP